MRFGADEVETEYALPMVEDLPRTLLHLEAGVGDVVNSLGPCVNDCISVAGVRDGAVDLLSGELALGRTYVLEISPRYCCRDVLVARTPWFAHYRTCKDINNAYIEKCARSKVPRMSAVYGI